MGLDTTHDCWHGSYSSFMSWRTILAHAAWDVDLMQIYGSEKYGRDSYPDPNDPLVDLLDHSDCDGELKVSVLLPLADRLEEIIPMVQEGRGYSASDTEYFVAKTKKFVAGLRRAAKAGEPVEFH